MKHDPEAHYDRVTSAWGLLLGEELHYGLFTSDDDDLATATRALTDKMLAAARITRGLDVLDVGCGTGAPAVRLAEAGARVTGISNSSIGVDAARARIEAAGLTASVSIEKRDAMDNGLPDHSFDRAWVLESSHLMRERSRLFSECFRVLRPRGRLVLCDVMLARPMGFEEVRELRVPLALLREVFGDAQMLELDVYVELARDAGFVVDETVDLTELARPTFARWRDNALEHEDAVVAELGREDWRRFVDACDVLERLWAEDRFGYYLLAADRPAED